MLNKEMMLTRSGLGGYDQHLEAQITAANGYVTTNPGQIALTGYTYNYMNSVIGSCTNQNVGYLYDDYGQGSSVSPTLKFSLNDFVDANSITIGRFALQLGDVTHECYFSSSRHYEAMPLYSIRATSDFKGTSTTVVSCDRRDYPRMFSPDDIAWQSEQSGEIFRLLYMSDTYIELGPIDNLDTILSKLPAYGFKAGDSYDFSVDYKIDAIITEDGVQTF